MFQRNKFTFIIRKVSLIFYKQNVKIRGFFTGLIISHLGQNNSTVFNKT